MSQRDAKRPIMDFGQPDSGDQPPPEAYALPDGRLFPSEYGQRERARALYNSVRDLPIIAPHGHVDPRLFADPAFRFGSPVDLLIIPDHYVFRMLYSQGIPLENLGIPRQDGGPVESDHRRIWRTFAEHFYLFRGTPSGNWLEQEMVKVLGVTHKLKRETADLVYDQISAKLEEVDFTPRQLYERFKIEVLCTTDAATSALEHHRAIRDSGWQGRILPTFRPDACFALDAPGWSDDIARLSALTGTDITNLGSFVHALEARRAFFKEMGAVATDHGALTPDTTRLSVSEAEAIFARALKGEASAEDAQRFQAHMLLEMVRMSTEDGLVMQLHVGSYRNHNPQLYERFGDNAGADMPVRVDWVRGLKPLLDLFGNDARLTVIAFTLDESSYSRELAPLAGHYPALKLGPPWWFHDSLNGMRRYFEQVMETAGLYNTVGFNDDTRAFLSIPARHDVWRRACANWLADLVGRHVVDHNDAEAMMHDLAYHLAKRAYKL